MINTTSQTYTESTIDWVSNQLNRAIVYAQELWFELDFDEWDDFLAKQVFKFYNKNGSKCLIYSRKAGFYAYTCIDEQWNSSKVHIFSDNDVHLLNSKEFSYFIDWVTLIMNDTFTVVQSILTQKEQSKNDNNKDSSFNIYVIGSEKWGAVLH